MTNQESNDLDLRLAKWARAPVAPYCVAPSDGSLFRNFLDFNREVVAQSETFPRGVVGVRVDDDFWIAAQIPYEFRHLTIERIVAVLWPALASDPETSYGPDSPSADEFCD